MDKTTQSWYECKVQYERTTENGVVKKVKECYYIDALSLTEAENKLIGELSSLITGEFEVVSVKKDKTSHVTKPSPEDGDTWYKVKTAIVSLDEKTGAEKTTFINEILRCDDVNKAIKKVTDGNEFLTDWRIYSVTEVAIEDVFFNN